VTNIILLNGGKSGGLHWQGSCTIQVHIHTTGILATVGGWKEKILNKMGNPFIHGFILSKGRS